VASRHAALALRIRESALSHTVTNGDSPARKTRRGQGTCSTIRCNRTTATSENMFKMLLVFYRKLPQLSVTVNCSIVSYYPAMNTTAVKPGGQ
jgi:hypothetical protein